MTTEITAIVWADANAPNDKRIDLAEEKAKSFPNELFDDWAWNETCEEIGPLQTARGDELIANALSKTERLLEDDIETVRNAVASADSERDLLSDTDFRRACRTIGDVEYGRFGLYDASDYAFGTPVIDWDGVDDILDHHEDGLYVARVSYDR